MTLKKGLIRTLNNILKTTGIIGLLMFLLSLTDIPYHAYHWLGTSNSTLNSKPDIIVLMGGSGMPSPDGLIRCYYAAEAAMKFQECSVMIALPSGENGNTYQLDLMAKELILRGVDSSRIHYEPNGFNTYSQASNIATISGKDIASGTILLITSPEHMYRSVKCFKKAGFGNVGGIPAFEKPIDPKKIKDNYGTVDKHIKSPELRYNIWSYLHYELLVIKEFFAISYYKIKGWI